jgi:hypothetical protein
MKKTQIYLIILICFCALSSCSLFLSSEPAYKKAENYTIKMNKEWKKIEIPETDKSWKHSKKPMYFYIQSICGYYPSPNYRTLLRDLMKSYPNAQVITEEMRNFQSSKGARLIFKYFVNEKENHVIAQNFSYKGCYFDLNLTFKNAYNQDTLKELEKINQTIELR